MLKKPSLLSSSYSNFHCLYSPNSSPNTSTTYLQPSQHQSLQQKKSLCRNYATLRPNRPSSDHADEASWPDLPNSRVMPTPYQIFKLKKDAPYSKRRFYELVKIYHPDRNGHDNGPSGTNHLSDAIKMERYRLIVAAHQILSDPEKRSAYDASGAGWNGRPIHGAPRYHWGQNQGAKWSGFDTNDSPFRNATWEDWERWYTRDRSKQQPVYVSNGGFLILVIAAVSLGGFGQSLRASDYSNVFERQVEKVHDDASKVLRKRKTDSTSFGNRDERLQNFLLTRDPRGYGIIDPKEESYRKLLPEPELCMSEAVHQRGHDHVQSSS
ncbi:hypothetical protein N7G274_001923 [Stereocaulon virgatum]|uniref:J domain-containing protein n=1 Tax=Stereocaulon virgatum TaxID=373712 RepID=A0ABR4AJZ5_9LECA